MSGKRNAPPGRQPGGAEAITSDSRKQIEGSQVRLEIQGFVSLLENGCGVTRIIFGGQFGLIFEATPDGFVQVGTIAVGGA